MELIRLEEITKTYHLGEVDVQVLKGISLSIARGEMVALMGASGSGKTTLMNILGCLDRPTSGHYWLDGQDMSRLGSDERALVRSAKLGFVFQSFNLLARTDATHNVIMPLDYAQIRPSRAESRRLAQLLLERVGLSNRCDHEPSQMSGGQQQRVAIARALVGRPALVLADEPTGNLDSQTSVEILRMFQQLNTEGITVVLVTHDPQVAAYAHRTIRIVDGLIPQEETNGYESRPEVVESSEVLDRFRLAAAHRFHGNGAALATAEGMIASREGPNNGSRLGGGDQLATDAAEELALETVAEVLAAAETIIHSAPTTGPTAAQAEAVVTENPHIRRLSKLLADPKLARSMYDEIEPRPHRFPTHLPLPTTLRTALGALRVNKMRSALTALGVIIGVAAVIAMTEIGQGSKIEIQKAIASMGANNLLILPGAVLSGSVNFGSGTSQTLKPSDHDEILRQCPDVVDVAPIVWARAQVVYGNRNWIPKNMNGTSPAYLTVRDWEEMDEGYMFTDRDVREVAKVCVIGTTIKRELFPDESPVGKDVRIQNVPFRVVGVLGSKGGNMMGQDQDDILLVPWTTVKLRLNGNGAGGIAQTPQQNSLTAINSLNGLYPGGAQLYDVPSPIQADDTPQSLRFINFDMMIAKATSAGDTPDAINEITSLLRERHHLGDDRGDDFDIRDMTEITTMRSKQSELVGLLLTFIASISLVVGGVGIMNIMLVSVTERTREIGLRMAVGARGHHILRQFLVEAVLLCLLGGAIGILFGRGASIVVRSVVHWPTAPSIPVIVVAVLVSAGVGIIFGFYPAWKASRLDPIEALRYE